MQKEKAALGVKGALPDGLDSHPSFFDSLPSRSVFKSLSPHTTVSIGETGLPSLLVTESIVKASIPFWFATQGGRWTRYSKKLKLGNWLKMKFYFRVVDTDVSQQCFLFFLGFLSNVIDESLAISEWKRRSSFAIKSLGFSFDMLLQKVRYLMVYKEKLHSLQSSFQQNSQLQMYSLFHSLPLFVDPKKGASPMMLYISLWPANSGSKRKWQMTQSTLSHCELLLPKRTLH